MSAALKKKEKPEDDSGPKPPPIPKAKPPAAPPPEAGTAPVAKPSKPEKATKEKKAKEPKAKKVKVPKEKGDNKKTLLLLLIVVLLAAAAAVINLSGMMRDKGDTPDSSDENIVNEATGDEPKAVATKEKQEEAAPVEPDVPMREKRIKSDQSSWLFAKKRLNISATMRGAEGQMLAVVNGKMLKVGDTAKAEYEGTTFYWRLTSIENNHVEWKPLKSTIMVPDVRKKTTGAP